MKALVGAFNQEKALVGAFSVIVQPVVEPMEHYTALVEYDDIALITEVENICACYLFASHSEFLLKDCEVE